MAAWQDGEQVSARLLERLSRRLSRFRISIIQNEWALSLLDRSQDAAQFVRFKDGSAAILHRPDATRYQLLHELKHAEHWLSNPVAYAGASKLERESFVFEALRASRRWQRYSSSERRHAVEYIQYLQRLYGRKSSQQNESQNVDDQPYYDCL